MKVFCIDDGGYRMNKERVWCRTVPLLNGVYEGVGLKSVENERVEYESMMK